MRFLELLCLAAGIHLVARVVRSLAHAIGMRIEYDRADTPGLVTLYVITLLAVLAFVALVWKNSPMPMLRRYWAWRSRVLAGFLVTGGLTFVTLLIEYGVLRSIGMAGTRPVGWARIGGAWTARTLVSLLIVVLLAATEELIFRGFVFNYLRGDSSSMLPPIAGSAFIFALAHHFPDPEAWLSPHEWPLFAGLLLLGGVLALAYQAAGSLACAVGIHAALLTVEVLARHPRTRIVFVSQSAWWMGTGNDLRTAPLVWAQFVLLGLAIWWTRRPLRELAEVEQAPP
jgi:membrane protease YdiL (CAAX protease family)